MAPFFGRCTPLCLHNTHASDDRATHRTSHHPRTFLTAIEFTQWHLFSDGHFSHTIIACGLVISPLTPFAALACTPKFNKTKDDADVHQPAAIKQLQILGKSIGVVFSMGTNADPVEIAAAAVAEAKAEGCDAVLSDAVLINAAGRRVIDADSM
jgi:hypothetical protein